MVNKPTMSTELKYKNPSAVLRSMVSNFATTFQGYMKNSAELLDDIRKQAEKEGIPKEQLRKIIEQQLTMQGLAKSSIRRILPAELKNQNMVRKQNPKKEPLVNKWSIKFNIPEMWNALKPLYEAKHTRGEIIHDNKRVLEVLYE